MATDVTELDTQKQLLLQPERVGSCGPGDETAQFGDDGRTRLRRDHDDRRPDPAAEQGHHQRLHGLMNLPILGALFRSRDFQRDETS